jgi:hypothetical protein
MRTGPAELRIARHDIARKWIPHETFHGPGGEHSPLQYPTISAAMPAPVMPQRRRTVNW